MTKFYHRTPVTDLKEEHRRRVHAAIIAMYAGAQFPTTTPPVDPLTQYIFNAPLTTTLVPVRAGDPTFTFTRATTAYVADNEGILRNAVSGEARFQGARRVQNYVTSTVMTSGTWSPLGTGSVSGGVADPLGGTAAYQINLPADSDGWYNFLSNIPAGTGRASVWLKADAPGTVCIMSASGFQIPTTTFNVTTSWQRFCAAPTTGAADQWFLIRRLGTTLTKVYAFQPQMESVGGQSNQAPAEFVSVGVLAAPYHGAGVDGVKYFGTTNGNSVAANVVTEAAGAAIPAATLLGYVAENQATNLCRESQTFDVATWLKNNSTVTANTQTAPDGSVTADTFTDNATNAKHSFEQSGFTIANATPYTVSVYAKQGTLPWIQLLYWDTTTIWFANFNLATGAVGNKLAGVTATSVALPNGWFRFSMTFTSTNVGNQFMIIGSLTDAAAAQPTYVGTGQTMYLWGAMVEAASDASSPIPTTAASVTRNIDMLTYPAQLGGSLIASLYSEHTSLIATGITQWLVRNTLNGSWGYRRDPSKVINYEIINTVALGLTANACGAGINKAAARFAVSNNAACLNGGAVITNANATAYVASGAFDVGDVGGALGAYLTIRNLKIYNTALTDAQLQTLTA